MKEEESSKKKESGKRGSAPPFHFKGKVEGSSSANVVLKSGGAGRWVGGGGMTLRHEPND